MQQRKIKTPTLYREFLLTRDKVDPDTRTVPISFSSEAEVERFWGVEILDHDPKSVRLGRLVDGGPLLVDHNMRDQIGVVEDASIETDRVGRAVVRFGKSARAEEIYQDVLDGIRSKVSVGYQIHRMVLDSKEGEREIYRATDWEPLELSIVSIPADSSVGVGRAAETEHETIIEERAMPKENENGSAAEGAPINSKPAEVSAERIREIENQTRQKELSRISDLEKIGAAYAKFGADAFAREAIAAGHSVEWLNARILKEINDKAPVPTAEVGMSDSEARQFSFVRALHALANPTNKEAQRAAGFEYEASAAAQKTMGKESRGIMVPWDVMKAARRDLTTSIGSGTSKAGYTVATDLLSGNFIDVLRAQMIMPALGATMLTGLNGNIAIPRKTAGATMYWVAENSAPTEGTMTFDQVTMTPKTAAAFVDFSRKLLIQSSLDVEAMVRNDLATSIAIGVDNAAINGSGSGNEPRGVLATSGIGSVSIGTNGGAPTWAVIVNLMKEVGIDNALTGSLSYLTNMACKAKLMQTVKVGSTDSRMLLDAPYNELAGYPVRFSNQVPSNLSKGASGAVLSALLFGNWSDLLIGQWGSLDLMTDPYTGSSAGTVRVTSFLDIDVAVRHPESFAECNEITTT